MMDNNNQWKDLLKESVKYPDGLSNVEERLENRINKGKRKGDYQFHHSCCSCCGLYLIG